MAEAITIRATVPAWVTSTKGVGRFLSSVQSGDQELAVSGLYFCRGNMDKGEDPWVRVGEAEISVRLISNDDLVVGQLAALREELDQARAAWLTKQQQIMEQIGKLQALTNEVPA